MSGSLDRIELDEVAPIQKATEKLHQQQRVIDFVHTTLGIPQLGKPGDGVPVLPANITALDDNQLGHYLSIFAQWVGYIDYQLANADGQRQNAEAYLLYIQARVRIAIKGRSGEKKPTVQDKSDVMETNNEVIEAKEKYMFWESTYRLTKSLRDAVHLAWETVSRRITQRGQEVDRMKRESNVGNVPSMQRSNFMNVGR